MKTLKITFFLVASVLTITACKKKTTETSGNSAANNVALSNFFQSNLTNRIQHFTVNATSGGVITGAQGTQILILGGILKDASGNTVSGTVDIELVEVYDRGSMVLLNKPTVGILPNGDHGTLISKGEYYLRISQNSAEIQANNGVIVRVPAGNIPGQANGMSLFDGSLIEGNFLWELVQDSLPVEQGDSTFTTGYTILEGSWGWTNVDRFYNDPRPKTTLKVKLPAGFDNTNSEVFITYDGEPGALASLDTYTSDGCFSEHYGLIPIGLEIHIIAVTLINGELNYAIQPATIVSGQIETINSFTPITQTQLAALINNLP